MAREAAGSDEADDLGAVVLRALPALLLPIGLFAGLYGLLPVHWTVTEAALVTALYALALEGALYRRLTPRGLGEACVESAVALGPLWMLLVTTFSLNRYLAFSQVPQQLVERWMAADASPLAFWLALNLALLALGCVVDILSAILLVAPLVAPLAAAQGIHPVHLGVVVILNLEVGYLTPPMGLNLFVASSIFERSLPQVARAVLPFVALLVVGLGLTIAFPPLSLWCVE